MTIQIATTFNSDKKYNYFQGLTNARPDKDSNALWFRLPDTLKWSLKNKKIWLESKIKTALKDKQNTKKLIKEVFVELLSTLETWFTDEQIIKIVDNFDKFNNDLIVPITNLENFDYLIEEFHWPTDAFKDIALQLVTSMVSTIVEEENKIAIKKAKNWDRWQKLKFVITLTSTSWDTWPAWWSWIEWKNFVMNVIWYPENEATFAQKWQMEILWWNVKALSMNSSFSNIQEYMLKANTPEYKDELKKIIEKEFNDLIEEYWFEIEIDAWSFNSINPWRVDGQTIYHSYSILQAKANDIINENEDVLEVIPSWNGWHMFSVLMARLMTEQKWKTIVTCNRNNMFYRIIEEGRFKKTESNSAIDEPSVSMIIEYPNNMIRLFAYAFWEKRAEDITTKFFAWEEVIFTDKEINILKEEIWLVWVEVTWIEELQTIWEIFIRTGTLVCPHTANAIKWLEKYRKNSWDSQTKSLISATASPWKFLAATATWLSYKETDNLEELYKEYKKLENSREWVLELLKIIETKYQNFWKTFNINILPKNLRQIYNNGYKTNTPCSSQEFPNKTIEFLKTQVASQFRAQVEQYI